MAVTSLRSDPPATTPNEFERLHRAWRHKQALWDVASFDPARVGDLEDSVNDRHCDEVHDALIAFLMHPATDARQLAIKLNVVASETAYAFSEASAIIGQIASDAHELIPTRGAA